MTKKEELSFEEGFQRLETILEKMQSGSLPLETSLNLFEEGDLLIRKMSGQLSKAEKRIEKLVKTQNGALQVNEDGEALVKPFTTSEEERETYSTA
jgi:exodeoxyribonuclease VII small subunit